MNDGLQKQAKFRMKGWISEGNVRIIRQKTTQKTEKSYVLENLQKKG